ncbi:hypothetical protein IEO21_09949 [Rhodonia placenta]|uniref:Uncharacterized protein n=1 Tax=Rhodonia placenta TaxID=104341 RepID=A0A8H7NTD8_9APHY|nr:hypothetical protein IEO21_09949 [Postia placenta]
MPAPRARRWTGQNHTQEAEARCRLFRAQPRSMSHFHSFYALPVHSPSLLPPRPSQHTSPPHDPRPHQGQRRRPRARRHVGALPPRALPRRARCAGRGLRAR